MAQVLDHNKLHQAFGSRQDILSGISKVVAASPSLVPLFDNIAGYVASLRSDSDAHEPSAKRRRIDDGPPGSNGLVASQQNGAGAARGAVNLEGAAAAEPVLLEVKEISVSIPQRKKFDIVFTKNYLYARAPNTLRPVPDIVYSWQDIEYIFYLPVPEKTQLQYNYILFPRNTCLPTRAASSSPSTEPFVFTIPATAPKPNTIGGSNFNAASAVADEYSSLFSWAFSTSLQAGGNKSTKIVASNPAIFKSMVRQAHRPTEPAVHVKAFRGSKDGNLFFLPTGILWGFKKPLMFIPLDKIAAISYTSVLQRTFNMVVEVEGIGQEGGNEEVEFGMLDQEDYGSIDTEYVRRHGLQDRSMAAARKAKRQLVEGQKRPDGAQGDDGEDGQADDGLTELERAGREAEQELQDEEDEEEEDYDPGSEGESEGSGESEEEDEDGGGGEEDVGDEEDEDDEDED